MNRLAGKVALVTGASRGIGRAVAAAFAEEGAWVGLCSRNETPLRELAAEIGNTAGRAVALPGDVTDPGQVRALMDRLHRTWGRLDILVNNAGVSGRTPITEGSDDGWHRILATNLTACYLVTKAALELMSSGRGRIVNISSVLGRRGAPGYSAYCASKHGLIGLTRALALELAPQGITVNAVSPGWVRTDMAMMGIRETAEALGRSPEELEEKLITAVPIRRFIEAEEVAKLVLYLASDEASSVTGQTLNICGGQSMD